MNVHSARHFALGALLFLFSITATFAQTSNGTITGTITDKTGGAIKDATVTVISVDRGTESQTAKTDSAGTYRVDSLLPGKYRVSMTCPKCL
jgi:protocatechuate 3,4-dioxygenase beta subunit